jgi:hypothetical protein
MKLLIINICTSKIYMVRINIFNIFANIFLPFFSFLTFFIYIFKPIDKAMSIFEFQVVSNRFPRFLL